MSARHVLAFALGVTPSDGSSCAVCGDSPFPPGERRAKGCFGATFTDYPFLARPHHPDVCSGCERLLSGRPGDDPPPLRTRSVLAHGTEMRTLDRPEWWALFVDPASLDYPCVLSWATSRKRHHWLHAGISGPMRWLVGTDHGTAVWDVADDLHVPADVLALLTLGARKAEVLSGYYRAGTLTPAMVPIDGRVAQLRGALILDLIVWAAPSKADLPDPPTEGDTDMIDPADVKATDLLAEIAWASSMRVQDGLRFWDANGFLVRRVRRFAHRDLRTLVSRLMAECGVGADSGARATALLEEMDATTEGVVLDALRSRPDLICALAFDRMKGFRARKPPTTETAR